MATVTTIGLGSAADDGNGDNLRAGGLKIDANFAAINTELVSTTALATATAATASANTAAIAALAPPLSDFFPVIKNSLDPTKLVRIDAENVPTGTTAVITARGDADLSGIDPHVYRASDYGVVADGSTDNSDALYDLFDIFRADRDPLYRVIFPEGIIQYSVNGWLAQCGRVILDAYGTSFQCTQAAGQAALKYPLSSGDWQYDDLGETLWRNTSNGTFNSPNTSDGFLIDTAEAGSTSVTFKTGQTLPTFAHGDLVVIQGFDQQEGVGFPRNMRYFDYLTVDTWTPGTRVLTFLSGLSYRYDELWPDNNGHGAARIFGCRGACKPNAYWNEYIEVRGATFLTNPNDPTTGDNLNINPEFLVMKDVSGPGLYVGPSRHNHITGGRWKTIEVDKLIESAEFDGTQYDNVIPHDGSSANDANAHINSASGTKNLTLRNMDFNGISSDIFPLETVHYDRCKFKNREDGNLNSWRHVKVNFPTRHVRFTDCWYPNRGIDLDTAVLTVTCGTGTTGRDIVLALSSANAAEGLRQGIVYWTTDGKGGVCTELTGDGAGNIIMRLDSTDTFAVGDVLQFHSVGTIEVERPQRALNTDHRPLLVEPILNKLGLAQRSRVVTEISLTSEEINNLGTGGHVMHVRGVLDEIEFAVLTAGPAGKLLQILYAASGSSFTTDTIDCGVAGTRVLASTSSGAVGSDSLTADFAGNFLNTINFRARDGGNVGWDTLNYWERARFSVKLKGLFI